MVKKTNLNYGDINTMQRYKLNISKYTDSLVQYMNLADVWHLESTAQDVGK